jgi:autotransporter-associated beta strand protein
MGLKPEVGLPKTPRGIRIMPPTRRTLIYLAAILLAPLTARAVDGTWIFGGFPFDWSNPANWSGGIIADGKSSTANFATGLNFINLDSNRTIGNLNFSGSGWYLDSSNGSVLTFDGNGGSLIQTQSLTTATISASLAGGPYGVSKTGPGTLVLSGTNSHGRTDLDDGILEIVSAGSLGTGSVIFYRGSISNPTVPKLAFRQSSAMTVSNTLAYAFTDGVVAGEIIQSGTGTTTLAGTMTNYTGRITANRGTLLINTAVGGTGDVQVLTNGTVVGGTLGGTGSLGTRKVDVFSNGYLAPGDGVGTFTVGNVRFWGGLSYFSVEVDLGPTLAADLLNVNGSVRLTDSPLNLALLNLPTGQTLPLTFLLVKNDASDAVIGQFGTINTAPGFGVTVNYAFTGTDALGRLGDGNDIAVTIVPEPAAFVFALTAAACLLASCRRILNSSTT